MGTLQLWATDQGLRRLEFHEGTDHLVRPDEELSGGPPPDHLTDILAALEAYFAGDRTTFAAPLDLNNVTPFQERVYDRLMEIPYGHVATYGEVARDIGQDVSAARAVGQAVGANPVAIIIPCHRVVASDGRLSGYGGGVERKAALLRHEGVEVDGSRPSSRVHPEVLRLGL